MFKIFESNRKLDPDEVETNQDQKEILVLLRLPASQKTCFLLLLYSKARIICTPQNIIQCLTGLEALACSDKQWKNQKIYSTLRLTIKMKVNQTVVKKNN